MPQSGDESTSSRLAFVRPPEGAGKAGLWNVLVEPILARRRTLYFGVFLSAVVASAFYFMAPDTYLTTARILPSTRQGSLTDVLGKLSFSLADRAGIPGSPELPGDESSMFVEVLRSDFVRDHVIGHTYRIPEFRDSAFTLYEHFELTIREPAYRTLAGISAISRDSRTGVVTVSVETANPLLSAQIAEQFLSGLSDYYANQRSGALQRVEQFLAERSESSQRELLAAEDELAEFQARNRNYALTDEPDLTKELRQLTRAVELKSTTFITLHQQHILARIEAEKSLPTVQVLDAPRPATESSGPHRLRGILAIMFLTAALIAGLLAFNRWIRLLLGPGNLSKLQIVGHVIGSDLKNAGRLSRMRRKHVDVGD